MRRWMTRMLYKHENNTDVAFEVIKQYWIPEKDLWKLKVSWWNIVPSHPPYCMRVEQRIAIPAAKRAEWKRYHDFIDYQ